jgi:GNAT superfamily N-acetyltransferase
VDVREISSPSDPAVRAFKSMISGVVVNFDIPRFEQLLLDDSEAGFTSFRVAEEDGQLLGATVSHYLYGPKSSYGSFQFVAPAHRSKGVGLQLSLSGKARMRELGAEYGQFLDNVDTQRMTTDQLAREAQMSDPHMRRPHYEHLGYRVVPFAHHPYMLLLYKPLNDEHVIPGQMVLDSLEAFWTLWGGAEYAHARIADYQHDLGQNVLLQVGRPLVR